MKNALATYLREMDFDPVGRTNRWYPLGRSQPVVLGYGGTVVLEEEAESDFRWGLILAFGTSIPRDAAEAVRWFRMAAEQGHIEAQFRLGRMYEYGMSIPEDDARRPYAGTEWLPSKETPGRNSASGTCTTSAGESRRTTRRPYAGTEWLPSRATPRRNSSSGPC